MNSPLVVLLAPPQGLGCHVCERWSIPVIYGYAHLLSLCSCVELCPAVVFSTYFPPKEFYGCR